MCIVGCETIPIFRSEVVQLLSIEVAKLQLLLKFSYTLAEVQNGIWTTFLLIPHGYINVILVSTLRKSVSNFSEDNVT